MTLSNWMTRNWDPLFDLSRLTDEMDRMFSDVHQALGLRSVPRGTFPAMNLYESDRNVTVVTEMPGVDMKDVKLSMSGNLLTLEGERKSETSEGDDNRCHRRERFIGRFSRTIALPEDVDSEMVEAEYKNGVLTVTVGKREDRLPRRIEIQNG